MRDAPPRRGLFALLILAAVALVCLLLGHQWLEGYLEEQKTKRPGAAPDLPSTAGVAGNVAFADGTAAAGARVTISWRDSADRPGTTPSMTNGSGVFAQGNVPMRATVTGIRATVGPLAGSADESQIRREGGSAGRARIVLPGEFRLAGLVRRAGDRAPIAGATLEVAGVRATTGADGDFRLERVAASVLRDERPVVRITAPGFAPLDWPLPKDALPETYGDLTIVMEAAK
jgi:hypothetical protein